MKRGLIALALLLALGAGIWLLRPAYARWRQQQALARAQVFLAREDLPKAALCARQVLAMNGRHPVATRIMARVTERLRSPAALQWWQRAVELEPDDVTNRLSLAQAALTFGELKLAEQTLQDLTPPPHQAVAFHEMAAVVAVAKKDFAGAEMHYTDALKLAPTNRLLHVNRAVMQLQSGDAATVQAARARLEEFAGEPETRQNALKNLLVDAMQRTNHPAARGYSQRLISHHAATFEDRLRHLSVLFETKVEFKSWLNELQGHASTNALETQALGRWLMQHQQVDEAHRWLTGLPEDLRAQQPVATVLADVHLARQEWAALVSLLKEQKWPEIEFVRQAMLARAYRELRQPLGSEAAWRSATTAAQDQPRALALLATTAGRWGWRREEEALLWQIAQRFPREGWVFQALQQHYAVNKDTRGLQRVYGALVGYSPTDAIAKNNFAATSLLLNMQTAQAHEMARDVFTRFPTNEIFVSTYAFSLHVQGRTAEAVKLLEQLQPQQLERPAIAAYYGLLLAATGERARADKYLELAKRASLLPEEQALLDGARAAR